MLFYPVPCIHSTHTHTFHTLCIDWMHLYLMGWQHVLKFVCFPPKFMNENAFEFKMVIQSTVKYFRCLFSDSIKSTDITVYFVTAIVLLKIQELWPYEWTTRSVYAFPLSGNEHFSMKIDFTWNRFSVPHRPFFPNDIQFKWMKFNFFRKENVCSLH